MAQTSTKKSAHCRLFRLRRQLGDVELLAFVDPLHEGLEAARADEDAFLLARGRVHDLALLEIRKLTSLGFDVRMAHVVTRERFLAGDCANFGHKGGIS